MGKSILIFSCSTEHYYLAPLIEAITLRGQCVNVFDIEAYPQHTPLSVYMTENGQVHGCLTVHRYGPNGYQDRISLDISQVSVTAWLRPSNQFCITDECTGHERTFARNESSAALASIVSVLPTRWINAHIPQESIVANKVLQQAAAARAGLRVPYTCITTDAESIGRFPRVDSDGCVVAKSIEPFVPKEEQAVIYTQRIPVTELMKNVVSIANCPTYVQEAIPKRYEYRVYVIGDEVLACRIDSQASERTRNDWRDYDHDKVAHTQVTLPFLVRRRLRRCLRMLNLRYGAVDMIETPEGEFVFLEVNSAGQYGWIVALAGLPIPEAFARMCIKMSKEWWQLQRWMPQSYL